MEKEKIITQLSLCKEKCKQYNLRITPQRFFIYKKLIKSRNHPSADDIFKEVRKEFPHISFDTVNRTLKTFNEIGLVDIVESSVSQRRFDPNLKLHHHLHCLKCGKIIDFYDDDFDRIKIPEDLQHGFTVLQKRVVLSGICRTCSVK